MSSTFTSKQHSKLELLLWGIAFPGFGQILNGHYIKAFLFIFLEIIINVNGNFNRIIMHSFNGKTELAAELANYDWLMFYPCIYFFAIWDAYKEGKGEQAAYDFFPFVSSAFFVTLGVIFSEHFTLFGLFPGPVLLPMLFLLPGLITGLFLKYLLNKKIH
ncbi:hypothetical protein QR721_03295 [Aciduricibacillus chroicocephali]|uniref:DUF5683 domain-containing protein n=1 Tax=Aciduricibacillus chroicocephali TaxID=3054939 RepID=A0ABY9KX86_9BACI|nr:hypothetical protein QR721_03295 [Bacillaceae bacterium 44XB]